MILLPAILVLGAVGALLIYALRDRQDRDDAQEPASALVGAAGIAIGVGVAVVVLAALVVTVGLRGVAGSNEAGDEPTTAPNEEVAEPQPSVVAADLVLDAHATELDVPTAVGSVRPGDVLVIRAIGFASSVTGGVALCEASTCGPRFPVVFDGDGTATFQYQVDAPAGSCGRVAGCSIRVDADGEASRAVVVLGAPVPAPGQVTVRGSGPVAAGDEITIAIKGASAPALLVLACDREDGTPSECARLTEVAPSPTGAAVVSVAPRARTHRLVVVDARTSLPIDDAIAVTFETRRPRYERARVAGGLAAAAVLLLIATALIRRTDWREPAAAATPQLL